MSGPNFPREVTFFKDFIPNPVRLALCLLFALSFQLTGGIYLASVSQMVGSLALMQEDIMMAGYASFVGMTMVFPVLFRLKFRFTARAMFLVICPVLILCNLVTMSTGSLPVLVVTCFVAGVFRMWGTFECLSNAQLSITPTRNFAVFFPIVYLIVLGSIQLSGISATFLWDWAGWRYMHLFIMGLLCVVWLLVALLTKPFRLMKPLPLYGIDWVGGLLWSVFLLSTIFVLEYGKFYDWTYSVQIRAGIVTAAVSLCLSIRRMRTVRHPYIEFKTFTYRHVVALMGVFLILCILNTTPTVLQNMLTGQILHFDPLNTAKLNWWNLLGTAFGAFLSWIWLAKLHGKYRPAVFAGFAMIVFYQCCMYFLVDHRTAIEDLYLPTFIRGTGYVILYVVITVYLSAAVPFAHFFQALSVLGFVRTGFGPILGTAVYGRLLQHIVPKNLQLLSMEADVVNPIAVSLRSGQLYQEVMEQTILVSVKELYGWTCIVGLFVLLLICCYKKKLYN